MKTFFNFLIGAGAVSVKTGIAAAPKVNRKVQRTLWIILGGLAFWPLVITSTAVLGGAWNGWLVAIMGYVVPVFLTLWAIITYWWLVGPALFTSAGKRFVGAIVFVAIGVMGIALYMDVVPVHNNASLAFAAMLSMAILVALVVASRLTGTGRGMKMFLGIVFVAFVAITAAIPVGGFGPLVDELDERFVTTSSGSDRVRQGVEVVGPTTQLVTLLGESQCSVPVNLSSGPNGDNYAYGPESTRIHWEDGTSGLITEWFGDKAGQVCFTGPAGERVTVIQVPHSA